MAVCAILFPWLRQEIVAIVVELIAAH